MDLNLKGKNALVCGSTQGIGKAIAEELANLGASVTLLARNAETLETAKSSLFHGAGQNHQTLVADFSKPDELKSTIDSHTHEIETLNVKISKLRLENQTVKDALDN